MLTEESIASAERAARRRETDEWVEYLQQIIDRNRPAFEREQAALLADGVIDKDGNLLLKELPADMQPGSGSDVGG